MLLYRLELSSNLRSVQILASSWRSLSILAWGRNVEGQCGVEGQVPLVARPTAILDLHQMPVSAVTAGTLNSAAILQGEVYTWGNGTAGKLGLGSGSSVLSPSRVEAFIGRTPVTAASLGHHHTLFLDKGGHLWACGENKEGQCGLGAPLEELASQHRRAYDNAMTAAMVVQNRPSMAYAKSDKYRQYLSTAVAAGTCDVSSPEPEQTPYRAQLWGSLSGSDTSNNSNKRSLSRYIAQQLQQDDAGWSRTQSKGNLAAVAAANGFDVQRSSSSSSRGNSASHGASLAGTLFGSRARSSDLFGSFGGMLGGADLIAEHMTATGLHPGQVGTPARIGLSVGQSSSMVLASRHKDFAAAMDEGLGGEVVLGMAASKYFSLAVTGKGEVWAFGADFNGALASEASWLSSPQRVAAPLAAALLQAGGAVAVAAGGTFGAALTANGNVFVWGKLAGGSPCTPALTAGSDTHPGITNSSSNSSSDASSMFAQVCLPEGVRITSISAGAQHLLLTDGSRVWTVGRWLDGSGAEVGVASWDKPQQMLSVTCPQQGGTSIAKVVAGMHASAALTHDGKLYMWGRLLDEQHGMSIVKRFGGEQHAAGVDWGWSGFGGAEPRLVEEVSGVRDVALGGWHAVVVVD